MRSRIPHEIVPFCFHSLPSRQTKHRLKVVKLNNKLIHEYLHQIKDESQKETTGGKVMRRKVHGGGQWKKLSS